MVDERRVEHRLRGIAQDLVVLHRRARGDRASMASDRDRLDAVKYTFVTTIEGCISVAQHLCASESWAVPATNADAFRMLARNGVLTADEAGRLARAAGFRNVLVHQYAEVDDDVVVAYLDHLGDIDAFVTQVTGWMATQR